MFVALQRDPFYCNLSSQLVPLSLNSHEISIHYLLARITGEGIVWFNVHHSVFECMGFFFLPSFLIPSLHACSLLSLPSHPISSHPMQHASLEAPSLTPSAPLT